MAAQDIEVHAGVTWAITFTVRDRAAAPLPLSGVTLEFRINDLEGELLTKSSSSGIEVVDEPTGVAKATITTTEQTDKGFVVGGSYFYEIRALVGDDILDEGEGRIKIKRSLFADVDPLILEFHVRFPEIDKDDTVIAFEIGDAIAVVNEDGGWTGSDRVRAIMFLAAHNVMLGKTAADEFVAGGVGSDTIQSIRIADQAVSFMNPNAMARSSSERFGFNQTVYGQKYLRLLRGRTNWIKRG